MEKLRQSNARYKLQYGGTGSGKSANTLMHGVIDFCLRWDGVYALAMRRVLPELKLSLIPDLHEYIPGNLFTFNHNDNKAVFYNGSVLQFGGLPNNSIKDLYKYQSASFPFIFLDECAQFSPESWEWLSSRNRVNPQCKPNKAGKYPVPTMYGCTNPIGPYWPFYRDIFVRRQPHDRTPGMRRDSNGCWWETDAGEWQLRYDPQQYACEQSTLLDNPYMMAKDPHLLGRLQQMSEEKRNKLLLGLAEGDGGQYFDVFSPDHVINLRRDPEAIRWEKWQPVWCGWDWGRAHYGAMYWCTKAQVKTLSGEWKLKTVVFKELVMKEKNNEEWRDAITEMNATGYCAGAGIASIYFSHERFAKQMERYTPAEEMSRLLRQKDFPSLTRGSVDRVGRATLLYNMLDLGQIVILDTCESLIEAIPSRTRDEKQWEDFEKIDDKGDDCLDAVTLSLFGMLGTRPKPESEIIAEKSASIEDPFSRAVYDMRMRNQQEYKRSNTKPTGAPAWIK